MSDLKPEITFNTCKIAGFILMLALWFYDTELIGFFLLLAIAILSLFRWRFPKYSATVLIDALLIIALSPTWSYAQYAMVLVLLEGNYRRFYPVVLAGAVMFYVMGYFDLTFSLLLVLAALCGLFLGLWEREYKKKFTLRDNEVKKLYQIQHLQSDLITTLPQVERMTAVAERTRIARDIHDNAGHEVVAAYISLQTARGLMDGADKDALELYDAALKRLDNGVNKIRETAHNLQTVTAIGVESLRETCEQFPVCSVLFRSFGDTTPIPVYMWHMLESCLNESLTNAARHAKPETVTVELDTTRHLVRLCIENDGVIDSESAVDFGNGLRNLRHRAAAIGGTFSVDAGEKFRVVCVIPLSDLNSDTA